MAAGHRALLETAEPSFEKEKLFRHCMTLRGFSNLEEPRVFLAELFPHISKMEIRVRRIFVLSTAVAAVSFCQSAGAKTLEEVLKEKGVITEADYKEVIKSRPVDYKLGKGFTFTNAEENFQLSLGGRMQFRYNYFDKDGGQDVSQWQPKRIKFYTSGYAYTKDLTYAFQADFVNGSKATLLDDAYLNYRVQDAVQVRIGQFKTPFVRQEIISDGNLQLVDRSPVVDAFKHGRDNGAMLHGKLAGGYAAYNVGLFGGTGQSTVRTGNNGAFFTRIAVNPFGDLAYLEADMDNSSKPMLSIGSSYLNNTLKKSSATALTDVDATSSSYFGKGWLGSGLAKFNATEKIDVNAFGADVVFKWRGFSLQTEYLAAQADGKVSSKKLRAQGFYAQTGYFLIPGKLEAAMRYSYYDPDRDKSNNLLSEVGGGFSYYFDKHNLKVQTDLANIHQQPALSDEIQFRVQAQITF